MPPVKSVYPLGVAGEHEDEEDVAEDAEDGHEHEQHALHVELERLVESLVRGPVHDGELLNGGGGEVGALLLLGAVTGCEVREETMRSHGEDTGREHTGPGPPDGDSPPSDHHHHLNKIIVQGK